MKNWYLFGLITATFVFGAGFDKMASAAPLTSSPDAAKTRPNTATDKAKIDDRKELQAPLDLSVPFDEAKTAGDNEPVADRQQSVVDTLFAPKPKNPEQSLRLKGGWLMSPEPEAEKKKTIDGAGIVIDLKP